MIANLLSIAGNDSSGGAGVAADLKTFAAQGAYGMAIITAVTAQNTLGVTAIHSVPAINVLAQMDAVFDDVRVDAVKIGMLPDAAVIEAVSHGLARAEGLPVVLDPVMCSTTGARLLELDALDSLRRLLLPKVTLLTPNLLEAAMLLECEIARTEGEMELQAKRICSMGPRYVLLKGGHLRGEESPDILVGPHGVSRHSTERIQTQNDHGTGCTLSAAIASQLPHRDIVSAVDHAKRYLYQALARSGDLDVGRGRGPLQHFF